MEVKKVFNLFQNWCCSWKHNAILDGTHTDDSGGASTFTSCIKCIALQLKVLFLSKSLGTLRNF